MCQINTEEMKKQIGCIDVLSKFMNPMNRYLYEQNKIFMSL